MKVDTDTALERLTELFVYFFYGVELEVAELEWSLGV